METLTGSSIAAFGVRDVERTEVMSERGESDSSFFDRDLCLNTVRGGKILRLSIKEVPWQNRPTRRCTSPMSQIKTVIRT